jgi:corrinoid protein of di/trimethylamine methyltransferase
MRNLVNRCGGGGDCTDPRRQTVTDWNRLYEAVLNGDQRTAISVTQDAMAAGVDSWDLVTRFLIPAMDEVGRRFECEEYFVPDLLLAGRAMKSSLELLRPLLSASGAESLGRVVIGTAKGDLHDIGKNLVVAMLEGAGFEVFDLGTDVSPEKFVEAASANHAGLVCLSALLTVTMPAMRTTIEAFRAAGMRDKVKILVGGAPITAQFAKEIGADGYGENAVAAVSLARSLVGALQH